MTSLPQTSWALKETRKDTRMENLVIEMHHLIHLTYFWPKLTLSKTTNKKSQFTWSLMRLFNVQLENEPPPQIPPIEPL